jgi:hypothetical protein
MLMLVDLTWGTYTPTHGDAKTRRSPCHRSDKDMGSAAPIGNRPKALGLELSGKREDDRRMAASADEAEELGGGEPRRGRVLQWMTIDLLER